MKGKNDPTSFLPLKSKIGGPVRYVKAKTNICVTNTNCICPGTLGSQPDTYLVPVNYDVGLGVWHINAYSIYQ